MGSSEVNDRSIKRARAVVIVAIGALLATVVATDPGGIGLIAAGIAAVAAVVALWWSGRGGHARPVGEVDAGTDTAHHGAVADAAPHASIGGRDPDAMSQFVVSLARRNGGLVDQQLALLDTLEASVEDPELLANYFKLDHLATRMRRNADSLLVLAGIDRPGLRTPQDIDEVVRAGISEIEDYRRIDVLALEHVEVTGSAATTLGHLVAELLDNATGFSPPQARVRIAGNAAPSGYEILIADSGIGISEARLDELNRKLALPPEFGAVGDSSIGLTVVSMLAARLGATVSLAAGEQTGMVATVRIPSSVLHVGEPADLSPALATRVPEPAYAAAAAAPAMPAVSLPTVTQLEAANAVAKLTLTVSGLPVRSTPSMSTEHDSDRLATAAPAGEVAMFWPPPAAPTAPPAVGAFAPPPTALQTALGALQVADTSEPRPVVEAQADRIGAAMASFARQREVVWESPLEVEPATS
jgi:signal transduction histidine kinase